MSGKKWTDAEVERLVELNEQGLTPREIHTRFEKRSYKSITSKMYSIGLNVKESDADGGQSLGQLEDKLLKILKKGKKHDVIGLSNQMNAGPQYVQDALNRLRIEGYNIHVDDNVASLQKELKPEEPLRIDTKSFFGGSPKKMYFIKDGKTKTIDMGNEFKFGAVADTHLGSKYERLDVLNALYDIFEKEGVKAVLHGGNYVDGEFRFNKYETYTHGFDEMVDNFVQKYPQRKGITTYFVDGDDHEGWWTQREGLIPGKIVEERARQAGRNDLVYLGYQERDMILEAEKGSSLIRLMHAGGGTAYADSYATQKMVESFQEGEKPHILLVGHYHKAVYHTPRGVHTVQLGTTQDQTRFMRKKKLRAALGGWLIKANQASSGEINRFAPEFIGPFWDKHFYENKMK